MSKKLLIVGVFGASRPVAVGIVLRAAAGNLNNELLLVLTTNNASEYS